MLTPGEFVMSKGAVQKYGANALAGMNAAAGGTNRPTLMGGYKEGGFANITNTETTSGSGGYGASLGDVITAYDNFANQAEYSINFLIQGPSTGTSNAEAQAKARKLIDLANTRKDCIACISPWRTGVVNVSSSDTQTENIIDFFDPLPSSSYAVFDSGYKLSLIHI